MSIELHTTDLHHFFIIEIRIQKKLADEDFGSLVTEIELHSQERPIRIFAELINFFGWSAGLLWDDTKFRIKKFSAVQRVAIVGDKFWARGMADFCKPFIEAKWRYYDSAMIEEAKKWIGEEDDTETLFH